MSHFLQRTERNCLNCGTYVVGKYCHNCGQENIEPKESALHLVSHFFKDITHFDGKFFTSIKDLVLKPGFLSKEYMIGRRATYLNPIRMYLFTSFIFFLIFFSLYKVDENSIASGISNPNYETSDSVELNELTPGINIRKQESKEGPGGRINKASISITPTNYASQKEYDSLIAAGVVKDNWIQKMMIRKNIEINKKYQNNTGEAIVKIIDKLEHSIPQMLFVLLPLFALILKLLYLRHRSFYYADHAIFTIHFYIFVFIELLIIFGLQKIDSITGFGWLQYISVTLILFLLFYLYKSMRNFYQQNRIKTILKCFLLLFSFILLGMFLFTIFFFITVFKI